MQKYELTIVMDAKATVAKRKAVRVTVEKTVELLKGKVGTVIDWGEKPRGVFIHFPLELTPDSAKKLSEKIKAEDAIIRHLLVRANN